MSRPVKVCAIVGARPNYMKVAPLAWAAQERNDIDVVIVHTGQHYDRNMSDLFFEELGMPEPVVNLGVGSASHAVQTADVMVRFEKWVLESRPDVVLVVGDVNSTIACALVAAKLHIPVVHVEAGLRSMDRRMPEEVNRVLTDAISDDLFVTEQSGTDHLLREGIDPSRIHFVGNCMIDTLLRSRELADQSEILKTLGLEGQFYGVVTIHRPSNVDDPEILSGLWGALERISAEAQLVFPVHPRTRSRLEAAGHRGSDRIRFLEPIGYLDFLKLQSKAGMILTDSGGIQEEATILGVPCLTMRENTERPVTIEVGCNQLVGTDPERITREALAIVRGDRARPKVPKYWDGRAAERIVDILATKYRRD
ncbi:MAG: UDP-N-acetylglucosamine 2-epimerase (non-hydrolyzing) [Planctomycetes bacterium]|nr:UDP-N-acetylglucosamine 2-epimerase (non-hydrolyzing) [Planctomycetota bacterium]